MRGMLFLCSMHTYSTHVVMHRLYLSGDTLVYYSVLLSTKVGKN